MSNSGIDHELSDKADEAAVWLSAHWWAADRPLVPAEANEMFATMRRKANLSIGILIATVGRL
jgi:hypothetical protein